MRSSLRNKGMIARGPLRAIRGTESASSRAGAVAKFNRRLPQPAPPQCRFRESKRVFFNHRRSRLTSAQGPARQRSSMDIVITIAVLLLPLIGPSLLGPFLMGECLLPEIRATAAGG